MILKAMREPYRLQHLESTNSLSITRGGGKMKESSLTTSVCDYREVEIPQGSVIYCDIPYRGMAQYRHIIFDHEAFYDWCEKQTELVVISEYSMPEDRFVCVASRKRKSTFSATNNALTCEEKLFVPKHQYEMYKRMMKNDGND